MYYTPNMSRSRIVCEDSAALILFIKIMTIVFQTIHDTNKCYKKGYRETISANFSYLCPTIRIINRQNMRHRIKAGKVGSFTPEKQKVEVEQLEDREVAEDVEEIFVEDSDFSNDDEALAAMEFYDSPDEQE